MTAPQDVRRLKYAVEACVNGVWGDEPDGEDDMVVVRVADFDRAKGVATLGDSPTVRGIPESARNRRVLRPGDLLIEKSGGGEQQPVGNVVLFTDDRPAVCSNFVARMPVVADCDSRFVGYVFRALYAEGRNFPHIKQTSGIQNLDSESYLNETAWLPARGQQEHIANFLDVQTARIDALIAEKERLLSKLDELRWARVGQEFLTTPHEASRPLRLKYLVAACQNGLWGDEPTDGSNNVIVVRVADFDKKNRRVSLDSPTFRHIEQDKLPHRLLKRGDLLIEKSGGGPTSPVGNVVMFDADVPAICSNFVARMPVVKGNDPAFVCLMFQALYALGRNVPHIKQTSGIQNLDADSYLSQTVPVPPLDKQRMLAQRVLADFASMESLEATSAAAVERLREYRSSLISAAVTGQLDVSTFKKAVE